MLKEEKRIRLKTKQGIEVWDILRFQKVYHASLDKARFLNEYQNLMNLLSIQVAPIFCTPVNIRSCDAGYKSNDCTLYLDVPISDCVFTEYYDWSDYMFYMQERDTVMQKELEIILIEEIREKKHLKDYDNLQIILKEIKPEWIEKVRVKSKDRHLQR